MLGEYDIRPLLARYVEGCIEPPKVVRGHATSYSAHIDGIVLSITKITFPVKHMRLHARYGYRRSTERFPGDGSKEDECYRFRYRNEERQSLVQVLLVLVPLLPV